jgi:uncharacterized protein YjbJ (UPF0337 family)
MPLDPFRVKTSSLGAWREPDCAQSHSAEPYSWTFVWESSIATDTNVRRWIMGSTTDKVSGVANQAAGKVKEAAGKATGSEKLEAEGLAQRAKGKGEKLAGDAKQAVKDATNKVADAANKKL